MNFQIEWSTRNDFVAMLFIKRFFPTGTNLITGLNQRDWATFLSLFLIFTRKLSQTVRETFRRFWDKHDNW